MFAVELEDETREERYIRETEEETEWKFCEAMDDSGSDSDGAGDGSSNVRPA